VARDQEDIEAEANELFPMPTPDGEKDAGTQQQGQQPDGPTFTRLVEMYYPNTETFDTFETYGPEPGGAACLAYVDANSPNHQLIRKLMRASEKEEDDATLHYMQMRIGVAIDWQPKVDESITLFYRNPFQKYFRYENLPQFQPEKLTFPSKPGVPWKEKKLRSWLIKHAYPLVNMRSLD